MEEFARMSSPGTQAAMGRVLLICNDSIAIQHVAEASQQFAIATEVCDDAGMALGLVNRRKCEGIVVDGGLGQAGDILEQVRVPASSRTAVTYAITDPQKPPSFQIQSNFVIERPLS